jgi:hypothetical protein
MLAPSGKEGYTNGAPIDLLVANRGTRGSVRRRFGICDVDHGRRAAGSGEPS